MRAERGGSCFEGNPEDPPDFNAVFAFNNQSALAWMNLIRAVSAFGDGRTNPKSSRHQYSTGRWTVRITLTGSAAPFSPRRVMAAAPRARPKACLRAPAPARPWANSCSRPCRMRRTATPSGRCTPTTASGGRSASFRRTARAPPRTPFYQGNTVKVTDPAGNWKIFTMNALGNLVQVTDPNPGSN